MEKSNERGNLDLNLTFYIRINSKGIEDLNDNDEVMEGKL